MGKYTKEEFTVERVLKTAGSKAFVIYKGYPAEWQPLYEIRKTIAYKEYVRSKNGPKTPPPKTPPPKTPPPKTPQTPPKIAKTFPDAKKDDFKKRSNDLLARLSKRLGAKSALVIDHPTKMRTCNALADIVESIVVPNPDMESAQMYFGSTKATIFKGRLSDYLCNVDTKFSCVFLDLQGFLDTYKKDVRNVLQCLDFGIYNQGAVFAATFCKTRGGASPIESRGTLKALFLAASLKFEFVCDMEDTSVVTHFFILRSDLKDALT